MMQDREALVQEARQHGPWKMTQWIRTMKKDDVSREEMETSNDRKSEDSDDVVRDARERPLLRIVALVHKALRRALRRIVV